MSVLDEIIITEICDVITVPSPKGENFKANNRCHYGLSFCTEGQITYLHNGKKFVSDPTHAIILPKGASYSLHRDKSGEFALINFECTNLHADTFAVIPTENAHLLMKDFEQIKSLFFLKKNRAKVMSLFYEIIHKLSSDNKAEANVLYPAIKFLEKNLSSPTLSNEILAQECNISEVYFRKLFTKLYGISPKQYILNARLEKAKLLLTDGALKVNAIAEQCGFSSPYHFCRIFKEKVGTSPSDFMKANRNYRL